MSLKLDPGTGGAGFTGGAGYLTTPTVLDPMCTPVPPDMQGKVVQR